MNVHDLSVMKNYAIVIMPSLTSSFITKSTTYFVCLFNFHQNCIMTEKPYMCLWCRCARNHFNKSTITTNISAITVARKFSLLINAQCP